MTQSLKDTARSVVAKKFGSKQDRLDSWPAYLGNEDGAVKGSRAGYVYVRYPSINSAAVEVYNGGVPLVAGLRVMVGYRSEQPNLIQALGVSDVRTETSSLSISGYLPPHAQQHNIIGGDPVFVDSRQITPLGVYVSSGFTVSIYAGNIQRGATLVAVAAQTVSLSAAVPTTLGQGRYVLIALDTAGAVSTTNGTINSDYTTLANADIPATPAGYFRLAAIRLYYGQSRINDQANGDVIDLRWPQERASNDLHVVAVVSSNTTLNASHEIVIVSNESTITLPTAVGVTGRMYNIIRSGTSNVPIATTSSQTISGDTSLTLISQWDSVVVVSDGSNWVRCS